MIGADVISLAELTQYALIMVSSDWQALDGRPLNTRSETPGPLAVPVGPGVPGSPFGPWTPASPWGP